MKLVRYGERGAERPGLVDAEGRLRDLSHVWIDLGPAQLSPVALSAVASMATDKLPLVNGTPRLGCPIGSVGKFIAIGLNYSDHAREANLDIPKEPIIFSKATSCLQGPDDPVMLPRDSRKTDWEVELGVVIGSRARYVPQDRALEHVAGYCVINDVSEREFQMERGSQWDKGKGCDTFGPVGPWLVTTDEVRDPQNLAMWLDVNGQRMQTGNTQTMIFGVATLVSYVSEFMTLMPGDIITTGTPPGVGAAMNPPRFLREGDVVSLGIEGLGQQRQDVVGYRP